MRRSIVLSLLAAAAVAVASVLALAGSAGASSRSPSIVCPQRANIIPPCCPMPPGSSKSNIQPACCPATCCPTTSTTCCPSTTCVPLLTISASPNPSRAGQKVVISGTAGSGAQVALWRKRARQSSFQQLSTTTAGSTGKYTFTLKRGTVMADQEWYVASDGAHSQTLTQQVKAVVALNALVMTHTIALRGHVTPSHRGERVLIEMKRAGSWHVIARPRLGRGSTYSVSHRFAGSGTVKFRVVLPGDSRNVQSTSRTLTVKTKL